MPEDRKRIKIEVEDEEAAPSAEAAAAEASEAEVAEELAAHARAGESERLAALERELAAEHERHLRAVAELQNYRRRINEEKAQQLQFANEQLISEILPLMDNFERATGCEVDNEAAENLLKGVCMIEGQFHEVLRRFGLVRMDTTDQFFDPARHEAVERVETNEVCEGTIVEEVLPGYLLNGRVIRPAKVKVAVQPHS